MRRLIVKLCIMACLLLGISQGPLHAQEGKANDKSAAAPKDEAPVFSYVIVSFATLIILLIVCAPSRRPVPTEEG